GYGLTRVHKLKLILGARAKASLRRIGENLPEREARQAASETAEFPPITSRKSSAVTEHRDEERNQFETSTQHDPPTTNSRPLTASAGGSEASALGEISQRVLWLATSIIDAANRGRPNPDGVKVGG